MSYVPDVFRFCFRLIRFRFFMKMNISFEKCGGGDWEMINFPLIKYTKAWIRISYLSKTMKWKFGKCQHNVVFFVLPSQYCPCLRSSNIAGCKPFWDAEMVNGILRWQKHQPKLQDNYRKLQEIIRKLQKQYKKIIVCLTFVGYLSINYWLKLVNINTL